MHEIRIDGFIPGIGNLKNAKAVLHKGKPLSDPPKTYKKIGTFGHNIGNLYNPGWLHLYFAKDGSLRYEIYRDGSIYPFYGRLELI